MAAQTKFKQTENEVIEINNQTQKSIEQQEKQYQIQLTQNLQRLQELQESTIYYQQQKIQKQLKQSFIDLATQKVDQKFQAGLNPKVQKSVNTLSIELLKKT